MKPSAIGMVLAAILMIAAGVALGIAQAVGNPSVSPVWSIQDQIETGNLPEPVQAAQSSEEFVPEGNYAGTDWQVTGPLETGGLPQEGDASDLDHSDVPVEGNIHQYWGSDNPSN